MLRIFKESNNSFDGMHPDENVLFLLREHWFVLYLRIASLITAALLPLLVVLLASSFISSEGWWGLVLFVLSAYYLALWYGVFYTLMLYSLNTWIVTTDRVVNSRQYGFFNRSISEVSLARIQDVTYSVDGFVATLMKYGNIEIQSAGTEVKFIFSNIPNPEYVKEEIMRLSTEAHKDL